MYELIENIILIMKAGLIVGIILAGLCLLAYILVEFAVVKYKTEQREKRLKLSKERIEKRKKAVRNINDTLIVLENKYNYVA